MSGLLAAELNRMQLQGSFCNVPIRVSRYWRRIYETVI
jgi:hypothetical protein